MRLEVDLESGQTVVVWTRARTVRVPEDGIIELMVDATALPDHPIRLQAIRVWPVSEPPDLVTWGMADPPAGPPNIPRAWLRLHYGSRSEAIQRGARLELEERAWEQALAEGEAPRGLRPPRTHDDCRHEGRLVPAAEHRREAARESIRRRHEAEAAAARDQVAIAEADARGLRGPDWAARFLGEVEEAAEAWEAGSPTMAEYRARRDAEEP